MEKEYLNLLSETIPSLCLGDEAELYELIFETIEQLNFVMCFQYSHLTQIWRILLFLSYSRFDWQIHSN